MASLLAGFLRRLPLTMPWSSIFIAIFASYAVLSPILGSCRTFQKPVLLHRSISACGSGLSAWTETSTNLNRFPDAIRKGRIPLLRLLWSSRFGSWQLETERF